MSKAWEDQDDQEIKIDLSLSARTKKLGKETVSGTEFTDRLREKYKSIYSAQWGEENKEKTQLGKLFLTSKSILSDKTPALMSGLLDVEELKHSNFGNYSKSVISDSEFQGNRLLIAGKDKRIRLFEVPGDDEDNLKASVFFKDLPVVSSKFCGDKIYVSGEKPFFYVYDQVKEDVQRVPFVQGYNKQPLGQMRISPDQKFAFFLGKNGKLMQVSTQSQKLICDFKMNSDSNGLCFVDEYTVACGGDEGDIYLWDLKMRSCIQRFSDEGTVKITCLESKDNFLAVGSNSGVVNLYDTSKSDFRGSEPKPIKSVMNLTTDVTGVSFNYNCEVLAMYSKWKRDAVKLLHVPSLTVFSNWPSFKDRIKYPTACCFNSTSELFSIGNDEGVSLLYKLNHYC